MDLEFDSWMELELDSLMDLQTEDLEFDSLIDLQTEDLHSHAGSADMPGLDGKLAHRYRIGFSIVLQLWSQGISQALGISDLKIATQSTNP